MSPRARDDSLRSRLQSGASVRPLNFTVRFQEPTMLREIGHIALVVQNPTRTASLFKECELIV